MRKDETLLMWQSPRAKPAFVTVMQAIQTFWDDRQWLRVTRDDRSGWHPKTDTPAGIVMRSDRDAARPSSPAGGGGHRGNYTVFVSRYRLGRGETKNDYILVWRQGADGV